MSKKKITVGQAAYDLLKKTPEKVNVIDMQREMQKSVVKEINDIIEKHKGYADEYYIVYMLRRERLISNAIRQMFIVRKTRPKPDHDCSLFSYNNLTGRLDFHWTIPDADSCVHILKNKDSLGKDEKQLYEFVEKFSNGLLV